MFSIKRALSLTSKSPTNISRASVHIPNYKLLDVKIEGPVFKIAINNLSRLNSLCLPIMVEIDDAVNRANECKDTKFTVVTGNGKYFSTGMDLKQFLDMGTEGIIKDREKNEKIFANFVDCFLNHDKVLIGAINGPAIGGAASMTSYFDYNICSEDAFFFLPFTKFAITPVDLISVYFPRIIGKIRATEMMLLEKKLTAKEALQHGLVNEVVKKEDVWKVTMERVKKFSIYESENIKAVKDVIKYDDRKNLPKKSEAEIKIFFDRLCDPKFMEAVKKHFKK
uniref:ClpP/crotonase n=1 Tax=Parastrongyloides trichosuri TaxID=131310 RepID=A0A0N5A6G6_PARTI